LFFINIVNRKYNVINYKDSTYTKSLYENVKE